MGDEALYEIELHILENGRIPFELWMKSLDAKIHDRIMTRLDRVQLGNFGDYKAVGKGVFELRFFFGSGYRVYYGLDSSKIILLLTGGDKKSQSKDVSQAQKYWKNYIKEKSNGEH